MKTEDDDEIGAGSERFETLFFEGTRVRLRVPRRERFALKIFPSSFSPPNSTKKMPTAATIRSRMVVYSDEEVVYSQSSNSYVNLFYGFSITSGL